MLLGIAFVVAVATTGIFYGLFVNKLGAVGQTPIVVAVKNLNPGTTLTPDSLRVTNWTGSSTPIGAFTSVDQVAGRTTSLPIEAGSPVSVDKLSPVGMIESSIPANSRAVSTHVTDSVGVLEMIHPGDHVDVQTLTGKDRETEIRTILEDRRVLAVHSNAEAVSHEGAATPIVTLLVDQTEADALALADSSGRVRLTLRNPKDDKRTARTALTLMSLMHSAAPPPSVTATNPPAATDPRRAGTFTPVQRVN